MQHGGAGVVEDVRGQFGGGRVCLRVSSPEVPAFGVWCSLASTDVTSGVNLPSGAS